MNAVPYTSEPRPDTGLYNAKVGTWLFLAAETMFFGALFSSYVFLRTAATEWPNGSAVLPTGIGAANVLCVILLAIAGANAWSRASKSQEVIWLWVSIALGAGSILLIAIEHRVVSSSGVVAATSTFFGMYYLLTGLLRFHVVAGVLLALYLATLGRGLVHRDRRRYVNRLECLGLYWQLLGLMSIATFALIYFV